MWDWASWDALQSILAVLALFGGGYGGARAAGVVRIRMDERRTIWADVREFDDRLAKHEQRIGPAQQEIVNWAEALPGHTGIGYAHAPESSINEINASVAAWLKHRPSLALSVELLTWSERTSFRQYEATLPTVGDLESARALASAAHRCAPGNAAEKWPDALDAVRTSASAVADFCPRAERGERLQEFVTHLHRRLRPGWWRRPEDVRYTVSLIGHEIRRIFTGK